MQTFDEAEFGDELNAPEMGETADTQDVEDVVEAISAEDPLDNDFLEAERRLQEAEYYRILLTHPLFGSVPDQELAERVQEEVRVFVRTKMKDVLLGRPKAAAALEGAFSDEEIKALKVMARLVLTRPRLAGLLAQGAEAPKAAAPATVAPRRAPRPANPRPTKPAPKAPTPKASPKATAPKAAAKPRAPKPPAAAPAPGPAPGVIPMPSGAMMEMALESHAARTAQQVAMNHAKMRSGISTVTDNQS